MSKNLLEMGIALARAAYGDFTALGLQAVKRLPSFLKIVIPVLLLILMIPAIFVTSLFTGSKTELNSDFSAYAVDAINAYKEDWIKVLALAQTKKVVSDYDKPNLAEAYEAIKSNKVKAYLQTASSIEDGIMDIYNRNLQMLQSLYSSYAGNVLFYDEIPYPGYEKKIYKKYAPAYGLNVLEMLYYTNDKPFRKIIYSSNDVVNFKISTDRKLIKIKYQKYTQSAYFPIPSGYQHSFSDSFGASRIHDGKPDTHEGIDIFVQRNTPIICIEDSAVEKIGWNALGGWRISLKSKDGLRRYYYAHMERYIDSLSKYMDMGGRVCENPGISFKAGDVIGFVGSSGSFNTNTPPGADTGTEPHIHLQLWVIDKGWFSEKETLMNPYYSLKLLEHSFYSEELRRNKHKLESEGL